MFVHSLLIIWSIFFLSIVNDIVNVLIKTNFVYVTFIEQLEEMHTLMKLKQMLGRENNDIKYTLFP